MFVELIFSKKTSKWDKIAKNIKITGHKKQPYPKMDKKL